MIKTSCSILGWESPCSVTVSLLGSWFRWEPQPLPARAWDWAGFARAGNKEVRPVTPSLFIPDLLLRVILCQTCYSIPFYARPFTQCHFMEDSTHWWSIGFSVDFNSFFFKIQPTSPGDISCSQTRGWKEGSELSNVLADVCSPHTQLWLFIPPLTFCSLTIVVRGPLSRSS